MKKPTGVRRPKFADEKYLGPEPKVSSKSSQSELIRAYNWFNYFYASDDAKKFTISYLKSINYDTETIQKLSEVKSVDLQNIGWNCKLLHEDSTLPDGVWDHCEQRIIDLTSDIEIVEQTIEESKNIISIQDRISSRAYDLMGELSEQIDIFFTEGVIQFDVKKWSLEKGIKPQIAKRIADKFRPQYNEIAEAIKGTDPELVEAYRGWRPPVLRILANFIKRIIDHMVEIDSVAQQTIIRKPRKKKVKPASALVAKLKFKQSDEELKLTSIDPKGIIGASQLWVYNTKTRNLSVYNAVGNSGLSVRGTTITGFDETVSTTKKLRKPQVTIPQVMNEGKVGLRGIMKSLTTNESKANGRINDDVILMRIVK